VSSPKALINSIEIRKSFKSSYSKTRAKMVNVGDKRDLANNHKQIRIDQISSALNQYPTIKEKYAVTKKRA
jgi:hypothetical protein